MKKAMAGSTVLVLSLLLVTFLAANGFCQGTTIGITIPMEGPYAKQGMEQLNGFKLAIKEINNNGGILGGNISFLLANTKSNPELGAAGAGDLASKGVAMISGGVGSSSAVAISKECQKRGIVFMAGITNSGHLTGKDAHRHTFRWYYSSHQTSKALSRTLIDRLGKNARYAYIYADYSWGQNVTETMSNILESNGAKTVYKAATPLGAKGGVAAAEMKRRIGFLAKLEEAMRNDPDALICAQYGEDLVAILQQIDKMGLNKRMTIVAPVSDLIMAKKAGPDSIDGLLTTIPWHHGLAETYEGSRKFVQAYEKEYGETPGDSAAIAYMNIMVWADAVKRAGTTDSAKVILALEDHHFSLLMGDEYFRGWDHQGIHPVFVMQGQRTVGDSMDYFRIVSQLDGEEASRTRSENPVQLESLPGEQRLGRLSSEQE